MMNYTLRAISQAVFEKELLNFSCRISYNCRKRFYCNLYLKLAIIVTLLKVQSLQVTFKSRYKYYAITAYQCSCRKSTNL